MLEFESHPQSLPPESTWLAWLDGQPTSARGRWEARRRSGDANETGDPFEHLIDAREHQVQLVIVHGVRGYGDEMLMQALQPGPAPRPLSTLNDLPFNTAAEPLLLPCILSLRLDSFR
jgi:hypothetical protein